MLEPLHACNLSCKGCGRIHEYKETLDKRLSIDDCVRSIEECGAPVVSICGGEPLLYHGIEELIKEALSRDKVTYLCINGLLLSQKIDLIKPHPMFNINIHLDGLANTHDAMTNHPGAFDKIIDGIKIAKRRGIRVTTNTTIYKNTDPGEIDELFSILKSIGVDGMLLSPSFNFIDAEDKSNFLTKQEIFDRFEKIKEISKRYRVISTPLYLDFLCGKRDYNCSPWGNVTYNVNGWKAPCYLITDTHYKTFNELMKSVDWDKYSSGSDPRCKDCMVHSGFEASVTLGLHNSLKDKLKMGFWLCY